ncbi:MAG: T9SS type A sorting domain-containing protein [bacterium]|nr:T9SS type A sorting domain-containing protein [bacterium]
MNRTTLMITLMMAGVATAGTFNPMPYLPDNQIDALTRQVANQMVNRDLFAAPYATVVVGNVDIYDHFPYLEARYFQVVSDPGWNRLVYGELDRNLQAFDGHGSSFGPLDNPRGLATDGQGRIYLSDTDNDRVLVFQTVTEFEHMTLVPMFAIEGLHQPHDVAFADGGTPLHDGDDALYVANTGNNEVRRYRLADDRAVLTATIGYLGSDAGAFAGPLALTVGRVDGAHTADIYVADAHNERLVHLRDREGSLQWVGGLKHDLGVVTSLTSDHWGNLYATSPQGGVVKFTQELKAVAGTLATASRPRGFHVPSVTITDHRTGTRRRAGEGRGVLVEEWNSSSGLRVLGLGVEIMNPVQTVDGRAAVDLFLTDHADLTATLSDPTSGATVAVHRAGRHTTGAHRLDLLATGDAVGWEAGEYRLKLRAVSTYDEDRVSEVEMTVNLARNGDPDLPPYLVALGNFPNPFNPSTTIRFAVPAGAGADYSLRVYDTRGRLVRELDHGTITPGSHEVVWDGSNDSGGFVGAGVYLYRVVVDQQKTTGKMVLLK